MRRFIACQNLERYRRLLDIETNIERRATLEMLLAEEEEKCADMTNDNHPGERKVPPERSNLS